jgi:hypothetical protein
MQPIRLKTADALTASAVNVQGKLHAAAKSAICMLV